jgi:hypothetical protein
MRRANICIASALVLAMVTLPLAGQDFEGVMKFVVRKSVDDAPEPLTQFTKGSKMRIEIGGQPGALVSDGHKWFSIFPDVKHFVIIPAVDMAGGGGEMGRKNGTAVKTGKRSIIAGIPCEVWHFTGTGEDGNAESGDACLAKGAGFMVGRMTLNNMGRHINAAGLAYNQARASGMGVMAASINGKVVLETIKVQAMPEADALFKAPPGYTPTTMGQTFRLKP